MRQREPMSESARGRRQKWRGRVPNKHAHSNIAVIGSELRHLLARSLSRVDDDVMRRASLQGWRSDVAGAIEIRELCAALMTFDMTSCLCVFFVRSVCSNWASYLFIARCVLGTFCYKIHKWRSVGVYCRDNTASNWQYHSAFRKPRLITWHQQFPVISVFWW